MTDTTFDRLILPYEDPSSWLSISRTLQKPLTHLADLDDILNAFSPSHQQTCRFFSRIPSSPDAAKFDFSDFWAYGVPLMLEIALEMPKLFEGTTIPLLLANDRRRNVVTLTRRQCACLLAHSAFGSITAKARKVKKEKWAFRAAQLFFLEALPSAFCFLNYFKLLGKNGIPEGNVTIERFGFERGKAPWKWPDCPIPLCEVLLDPKNSIENSPADTHVDFANRFIGGGCLENDSQMEEILFAIKPELIVSMAICSYMTDEEAIIVSGALQFSLYSGYGHSFEFEGDYDGRRPGPPPRVAAMDALQGFAKIQFQEGLILRDLNKARVAFTGANEVSTGNWGCGAFGNDHVLKFMQQWMAASEAGVKKLHYHTFSDKRASELPQLISGFASLTVAQMWSLLMDASKKGTALLFRQALLNAASNNVINTVKSDND